MTLEILNGDCMTISPALPPATSFIAFFDEAKLGSIPNFASQKCKTCTSPCRPCDLLKINRSFTKVSCAI